MPIEQKRSPAPKTSSKSSRKKQKSGRIGLLICSLLTFTLTITLWWLSEYMAESTWLTTLMAYAPPLLLATPTLLMLLLSLLLRDSRTIAFNGLAGLFVLFYVLGFSVPHRFFPPSKTAPHLRLMTYNVEQGKLGPQNIIHRIKDENPDVICLQECGADHRYPDMLLILQASLPDYTFVRAAEVITGTRLPVQKTATIQLIDGQFRRALLMEVLVDKRPFTIVTAHLATAVHPDSLMHHQGTLPDYLHQTAHVREIQTNRLLDFTHQIQTPFILCGDFNTPPRGTIYRALTAELTDAFANQGFGFGWTFRSDRPCLRIDYIFTGKGAEAQNIFVPSVRASDHRPVVADIVLL